VLLPLSEIGAVEVCVWAVGLPRRIVDADAAHHLTHTHSSCPSHPVRLKALQRAAEGAPVRGGGGGLWKWCQGEVVLVRCAFAHARQLQTHKTPFTLPHSVNRGAAAGVLLTYVEQVARVCCQGMLLLLRLS